MKKNDKTVKTGEGIAFLADGLKVYGPKIDGGYNLTLSIGNYERGKMANLIEWYQEGVLEINVKKQPKTKGFGVKAKFQSDQSFQEKEESGQT